MKFFKELFLPVLSLALIPPFPRCSFAAEQRELCLYQAPGGNLVQVNNRRLIPEDLRDQALNDGMTTLKQDGIEKIFGGNCDLLQVRKVCIK